MNRLTFKSLIRPYYFTVNLVCAPTSLKSSWYKQEHEEVKSPFILT